MKIAIAGGSGLIGSRLIESLAEKGHEMVLLTRNPPLKEHPSFQAVRWLNKGDRPERELEGTAAFVNLAGATINSRWTKNYKKRILDSRLASVAEIQRIIGSLSHKPSVLLNASAIGYYGTDTAKIFTEADFSSAQDFLAQTVHQWETAALKSVEVRTVLCRFGVVLDRKGGALPFMALPYRLFAGGKIGNGRQWVSWVHIEDVVNALEFLIEHDSIQGPVNITSPNPVTMSVLGKAIGKALNRPHWLSIPAFTLKVALGEMSTLLLDGQRALPEKLLENGFHFTYPQLPAALEEIFAKTVKKLPERTD